MDLIIIEERRSYGAFVAGQEWSTAEYVEADLVTLHEWLTRMLSEKAARLELVNKEPVITLSYRGSGADSHRITIGCDAADLDDLLRMLDGWFGLKVETPAPQSA